MSVRKQGEVFAMPVKCQECGYTFEAEMLGKDIKKPNTKCPRCGKIYFEKKGCEDCKGCSLWKTCKKT